MKTFGKIYTPYLLIFFLVFLIKNNTLAQVVINEVCTKNATIIDDEHGNSSDWIEIYNNGNTSVNLENYFLSDKADHPQKWQFPNKTILPQSYLLIFASDQNANTIYCHTNFKLSSLGETILLSDANGNELDRLEIPSLQEDHSYGRLPNGSDTWSYFDVPTPEFSNDNDSNFEFAKAPFFHTQQYFYETKALIEITCDEPNCEIRFTRDGSIPSEISELYTGAIQLDTTTCIRARTFSNDFYPSPTATQTYFINTQHTLPVIAMTSEPENFWDWENGIFQKGPAADTVFPFFGANFWKDIEIPMHFEYFKENELVVEFDVSSKIHGGKAARSKPMKAVRFLTDGNVPSSGMSYPFFENKNITNYRRLVLRNASGDYNYTHFRDAYLHRYFINEKLDLDALAHQPVVAYVNGIYWGVMNMREKIDRFYLQSNYGYDRDSIDLLEEDLVVIEGSEEAYWEDYEFVTTHDLSVETHFEQAKKLFDVNNMAEYLIVQTYVNNTDFPSNNLKFWQPKKEGGKWRYLLFDMDVGMGRHGWTVAKFNHFQARMENADSIKFIAIVLAFLENESYRNYFISRYADLMNTIFTTKNLTAETDKTVAEIDEEMKRHFQKWTWPGYDVWQEHRLVGLYQFIADRPAFQRDFVRQYFELENEVLLKINTFPKGAGQVQINTISPEIFPWEGYYYNGVPVTLTIIPNNGFTFKNWESIYTILEKNPSPSITYNFEKNDEITAYFEAEYDGLNLSVSPNPFEENINLTFTLDKITTVDIQVYDSVGRLVESFSEGKRNGGTHSMPLTIRDLDKGIYIISLQTDDDVQSIKLFK